MEKFGDRVSGARMAGREAGRKCSEGASQKCRKLKSKKEITFFAVGRCLQRITVPEDRSRNRENTSNCGDAKSAAHIYWYYPSIPPELPRTTRILRATDL